LRKGGILRVDPPQNNKLATPLPTAATAKSVLSAVPDTNTYTMPKFQLASPNRLGCAHISSLLIYII